MRWTDAANASSKTPAGTAAGSVIRSTASAVCCAPVSACSPTANTPDSPAYSPQMSTPRSRRPGAPYQRIVSAYRHPDRRAGKTELTAVIKTIGHGVPAGLPELSRLGRTLKQRAADVLAYFDRTRHVQRPDRGHQRPTRTHPRHRPRLSEWCAGTPL